MAKQPKRRGTPASLSTLKKQAVRHTGRGEYRKAEVCLRAALRSITAVVDFPARDYISLWNELGMVCKYLGKFKQAEKYYRLSLRHTPHCLAGRERKFFLANLYHNLGGLEHSRRRFRRGEKYARKALQLRRTVARSASVAVASDMVALAAILDGLRKFPESEKLYNQALRVYRREYGRNHAEIAVLLNNLAALYQATNQPKRAEAQYLAALQMKRRILGISHPDVAVTMNNLAMLYRSQGNPIAASRWFASALRILTVSLGSRHPSTRSVRTNYRRL